MKIAQVISGLGIGGAELIVCTLSDHLSKYGHEVRLYCLTDKVLLRPTRRDIVLKTFAFSKKHLLHQASEFIKFRRDLGSFQPDVIHTHLFHGNLIGRLANGSVHGPRKPLVSTIHNNRPPSRLAACLYRITDSLCNKTVAVSEDACATFVQTGACVKQKTGVIPNGIEVPYTDEESVSDIRCELRTRVGATATDFLFIAIGRAVWEKNYSDMVQAFIIANHRDHRLRLVIIGDGPELPGLKRLSQVLGISDKIAFLGAQNNASKLLPAADAFISTSLVEGFGLAIGEAMAAGLPVIGPKTGGVPNLIGDCGWLCEPGRPRQIADCMLKVSRMDKKNLLRLGVRARNRIREHFSESTMNQSWEALLTEEAVKKACDFDRLA